MLLYIIRHGEPDYETDSLTERGRLQAEAVGKRMLDAKIDRIFSSPMGRARQTAEPACRLLQLPCEIEEWTREVEKIIPEPYPPNTCYRENGRWDLSYAEGFDCPGIDPVGMRVAAQYVEKNGNAFLERLGYRAENGVYRILRKNEEKIALFCHAAFTRVWMSVLFHFPVHTMWAAFSHTHTGVTVIGFKNQESGFTAPQCLCHSDMSHLYAEKLDLLYNGEIPL